MSGRIDKRYPFAGNPQPMCVCMRAGGCFFALAQVDEERGKRLCVGLSNKLDSELVGRKPVKRSHGQVVGTAIMDGKLLCKIVQ